MTDREKLRELLEPFAEEFPWYQTTEVADHLIANGVTVQKWIPVSERLPGKETDVLMCFDTGNMAVGFWHDGYEDFTFWCAYSDDGWCTDCDCEPLYWMPVPTAPTAERI